MTKKLPLINYRKKRCVVDFKLGEIRCGTKKIGLKSIKFKDMPEGKNSAVKKKLRRIRFRNSSLWYIKGLDD